MSIEITTAPPAAHPARPVRMFVTMGDSTSVGLGDPLPAGGWRGFGPLLRDALGERGSVRYANLAFTGARVACVRSRQLPAAVRLRPDVVVLLVGMNDVLRSDFDGDRLDADYDAVLSSLRAVGATVVTTRYHDHSRVFWLPGPLRRVLRRRIETLNAVTDAVVRRHGVPCLDLHELPGGYERASWSVDRLHPSERGHRLLARGFGELVTDAGFALPRPVTLDSGGGRRLTAAHHLAWLLLQGVPWMCRRGRDLAPYALSLAVREVLRGK